MTLSLKLEAIISHIENKKCDREMNRNPLSKELEISEAAGEKINISN